MQVSLEEPNVNCKQSGASWKPGVTGTLPALVESSVHSDTAQPHGNMGTIVIQRNLMEASVNCEHGTA